MIWSDFCHFVYCYLRTFDPWIFLVFTHNKTHNYHTILCCAQNCVCYVCAYVRSLHYSVIHLTLFTQSVSQGVEMEAPAGLVCVTVPMGSLDHTANALPPPTTVNAKVCVCRLGVFYC